MEACRYCGGTTIHSLGPCRPPAELQLSGDSAVLDFVSKFERSDLVHCKSCDLTFRDRSVTDHELEAFYRRLPPSRWDYDQSKVGSWSIARTSLQRLYSKCDFIRIVDVGAFHGTFLSMLPDCWQRSAVEPSDSACKLYAAQKIDRVGNFIDDPRLDELFGQFDVVTLFDVFEHLNQPTNGLRRLAKLLKPGGRLMVSTGNTNHWTWKFLRGDHWYLHSAQHIAFANKRFFSKLAIAGLEIESITPHSHKIESVADRVGQTLATIHFAASKKRSLFHRAICRIITALPSMRDLRHCSQAPFGTALRDHFLIVFKTSSKQ